MIVGTTILRLDGSPYYSPEFARGGLAATFVVEVMNVALSGGETLTITVEHRNSDSTSWTTAGTFSTINSAGAFSKDVTGIEERVRLKFQISGTAADDAVHLLVQAPSWRPYG